MSACQQVDIFFLDLNYWSPFALQRASAGKLSDIISRKVSKISTSTSLIHSFIHSFTHSFIVFRLNNVPIANEMKRKYD